MITLSLLAGGTYAPDPDDPDLYRFFQDASFDENELKLYTHGTELAGVAKQLQNSYGFQDNMLSIYNSYNILSNSETSQYLKMQNAKIVNLAFGAYHITNEGGTPIFTPVSYVVLIQDLATLYKLNKLIVSATGNYNQNELPSPADNYWVTSVNGCDADGNRFIGPEKGIIIEGQTLYYTIGSNYGSELDLCTYSVLNSCGVNTYSWRPTYNTNEPSEHEHLNSIGVGMTSAASAKISAYASILWHRSDKFDNTDVENILKYTADDVGAVGYDIETGYGRVNIENALQFCDDNFIIKGFASDFLFSSNVLTNQIRQFFQFSNAGDGLYEGLTVKKYVQHIDLTTDFGIPAETVWASTTYKKDGMQYNSNGIKDVNPNYNIPYGEIENFNGTSFDYVTYCYYKYPSYYYPVNPVDLECGYSVAIDKVGPSNLRLSGLITSLYAKLPANYIIKLTNKLTYGTFKKLNYDYMYATTYTGTYTSLAYNQSSIFTDTLGGIPSTGYYFRTKIDDNYYTLAAGYYTNTILLKPPVTTDPIVAYTNNSDATAYSNARKMVVDSLDRIHVVYSSGDTIYHLTSTDDGETWSEKEIIGRGRNPAIGLIDNINPSVCWIADNSIKHSKSIDGVWASSELIYETQADHSIEYLAYELKKTSSEAIISWVENFTSGSAVQLAEYNPVNTGAVLAPIRIDDGATDDFKCPSIAIANDGDEIVSWSKNGNVMLYNLAERRRINLTEIGAYGIHPVVDVYGDKISVVWQELKDNGDYTIVKRTDRGDGFENKEMIVLDESKNAVNPYLTAGSHYVYAQENEEGNMDILHFADYHGGWLNEYQNISYNSLGNSSHPSAYYKQYWPKGKLYIVWTEVLSQDQSKTISVPIKIYTKTDIEPVEYIYCDCGTVKADKYLIERDDTSMTDNLPEHTSDIASNRLKYKFSGLNPTKCYRLKITFFNNTATRIQQKISIDKMSSQVEGIESGKVIYMEKWIPKGATKDCEFYVTIERHKGEFATCSEIAVCEYDKEANEEQNKYKKNYASKKSLTIDNVKFNE
ncbi:MAG: S8 family serine peptidase, partial [bacterium]|nr:S8 family serine peptidase [bacterium]